MLARLTTVLSLLTLCVPAASGARTLDDPTLEQRLEVLVERMEAERIANHIPGLALAVVKDGKVIFAQGFGLADLETGRTVVPSTIFAIGSTTKAFTSAALGMLQDDGVLDFDDPVTKYMPAFELAIEGPDEDGDGTVTLRDLLSHRTGFTRMSALWTGGVVSRKRVLETAVKAEPWAGFRERFLYNNVMYLAAGLAGASAADVQWEELIQTRIFDPLEMTSSTFSRAEAQKDARLALGYEWDEDSDEFEHKRMLALGVIGPAGSINSNIVDMAHWLQLMLANGEYGGEQLISEAALSETWSPQIEIGGGREYGMGWMLHERNGRRIVEHGGNINGFSAQVSLMPDEGLGYVLLANVTMTPLQQISIPIVFDTLLEDISDDGLPAGSLDEYLGNYRANFASFDDVDFEVSIQNGHLAVDVPGQMNFELETPDEEGKWYFRLTNTVAISFVRDGGDAITGMQMHQAGMTFDLPREGVEVEAEILLAQLERFLGVYEPPEDDTQMPADALVEVLIQNQHLAVDVPGEMVFELHVPDAEGKRQFRVTDRVAVRFNEDDTGAVVSFTLFEGDEEHLLTRLGGPVEASASGLPELDEFLALRKPGGRAQLLEQHGTLRSRGEIRPLQTGLVGTYVFEARHEPPAYRLNLDFGDFGQVQMGTDGETAWSYTTIEGYTELSGDQERQTVRRHPSFLEGDWRTTFDAVEVLRIEELDGASVIVAKAAWSDLPAWTMFVDAETGEVVRMDYLHDAGMLTLPTQTTYGDFREIEGVPVSHTMTEENDWSGRMVQTLLEMEVGVELASDFNAYTGTGD